jgi:hypothetical protein
MPWVDAFDSATQWSPTEPDALADLGCFDRVREPGPMIIALTDPHNLRFGLKPAKRR